MADVGSASGVSGDRGGPGAASTLGTLPATPPRRWGRVTAIASLTPLEELDNDPFLVDSRSQHAMCARWAAARGYVITRELLGHALRCDHSALWEDADAGLVDLFVAPSRRVLERALCSVDAFTAECTRRGIRVATAELAEPRYNAQMKAQVHRRLSMPTAGYDGR